jgi:hypothetical protein
MGRPDPAGRRHGGDLLGLPVAPPHPGQVPDPGDAVPAVLPGVPGAVHHEHRVHELRGRPPGQQAGRHPGHRRGLGDQGPRLDRLPAVHRHQGQPDLRRPGVPAVRPQDPGGPGGHARGPRAVARRRPGVLAPEQHHQGPRLHHPQHRPGRGPRGGPGRLQRAHRQRGDRARRPDPRLRGRPAAGLRRGLRLHQGRQERPDLDRERQGRLVPRRQGRQAGPGLAGQRRVPQLRRRAHQQADCQVLLPHAALELRLRRPDRGAHLLPGGCWWRSCSTTSGSRASASTARC